MNMPLNAALYQAAALIFEELGFLWPTPMEECPPLRENEGDSVQVSFAGPVQGQLQLTLTGDLLPVITANMLGEEDPPTPAQQLDALGELANVICGNLLPQVAGSTAVCDIGPPEHLGTAAASPGAPTAATELFFDEGRAALKLYLAPASGKEQ